MHAAHDTWEAHQRENQIPCLLLSSLAITAEEGPGRSNISGKQVWILDILLLERKTCMHRQIYVRTINISFYRKAFCSPLINYFFMESFLLLLFFIALIAPCL